MDQVVLVIANKVGDLLNYVGGPEYSHLLVPLIESLCGMEETVVRSAAAASACKVLGSLNGNIHRAPVQAYLALFKRLASEDSGELFYPRVSACQFVHALYKVLTENLDRISVREIFASMSRDEMSMVRRAAVNALTKLATNCESDIQAGELLQLLKAMTTDELQTVRLIAIENCVTYSLLLNESGTAASHGVELVPIIRAATDDVSWKIRLAIAKNYGALATCFPPEVVTSELLPGIVNLLQDVESDVRIIALAQAYPYFTVCGSELFMNEVYGIAQQLADDSVIQVRKNLAELCVEVTAHAIGDGPAQLAITEIVCRLLADEDALVRLRVIRKLPLISEEVPSLCTRITPSIKIMFGESNWRVRKELLLAMPAVVKHMGPEYFTEHFLGEYLMRFKDGVHEVRLAAASSLNEMVDASGPAWVYDHIFPVIRSMSTDEFLLRLSMLDSIQTLFVKEIPERFRSEMLMLLVASSADSVPNIRLRAAQVLGSVSHRVAEDVYLSQVKPTLTELTNDRDKDVKYFAAEALKLRT